MTSEELGLAAWPLAVGERVAAHTHAVRLVRNRLVIEVEDQVWQRQMSVLAVSILKKIADVVGSGLVDDLEFRVVPRGRAPMLPYENPRDREIKKAVEKANDEPISDPVLRAIYRGARRRSQ